MMKNFVRALVSKLRISRTHTGIQTARSSRIRNRRRLLVTELLEDRRLLAGFNVSGTTLQLNLSTNETVAITSSGTNYAFALTGGTWSGTNSLDATGDGTTSLSALSASFTSVTIDDSGANAAVVFNNSGVNTYGSSFTILLDNATAGAITFNGTSSFIASAALSVTTARNILVNDGANVSTVDGNLTFSANQQSTPTSGNFSGVKVGSLGSTIGQVRVTGTGGLSISGRGGTDAVGQQIGVFLNGGRVIGGSANVTINGTGGASAGNLNLGVSLRNDGNIANGGVISSTGGNVSVTGQGGGTGTADFNYGVHAVIAAFATNRPTYSAGGVGTLTINGTGGATAGSNHGVSQQGVITSGGGNITITGNTAGAAVLGSFGINILNSSSTTTATNGGNISLLASSISIGATVSTGASGSITIASSVAGRAIDLGSSSDPIAGPIGLSQGVELNFLNTPTLILGDANSGAITVSANISQLNFSSTAPYNLRLISGAAVNISGGSINTRGGDLVVGAGTGFNSTFSRSGNDVALGTTGTIGTLSFVNNSNLGIIINNATVDSGYNQVNVVGKVDLTGANLVLSGSFIPTTESFVIVSNDGTEPITGTFNGLAEGATVVVGGVNYAITYAGGDGNDVVLLPPATLNATAVLSGGDLTVADTGNAGNTFRVTSSAGNLIVTEANGNGFSLIPPEATLSADKRTMTIAQSFVTGTLTINGSGGNDIIIVQGLSGSMNVVLNGDAGTSDTINFGLSATSLTAGNIAATAETINVGVAVGTSSGTINLAGNAISILDAVNAGSNAVTLRTNTSSSINLGAADSAGVLGLTDTELDLVTAGTLNIGDANATSVTVSADITRAASTPISITSTGAINFTTGLINTAGGNLTLAPGAAGVGPNKSGVDINVGSGKMSFTSGSNLTIAINGATVDTQYQQLNVVGQVDLTGVNLNRTGSFVPLATNSFTIVNNDGVDPIIGTFNGLDEGATVTINGVNMTITYVGGDGNDVVLLPLPSTTATLAAGVLTITDTSATGNANNFTVSIVGPNLVIADTSGAIFATPPAGGVLSNSNQTLTIPLSSVTSLVVNGGLLNDSINIQGLTGTLNLNVDGGGGTDIVNFQTTATSITGTVSVTSEFVNVNVPLSSNSNDVTLNASSLSTPSTVDAGTGKLTVAGAAGAPIVLQDGGFAAAGGGIGLDTVFSTAIDADGNSYVVGTMNTSIKDFTGASVTGIGNDDVYVAKFNRAGVQQWFKLAGSTGNDAVSALTVDSSGNVYVAGTVAGAVTSFAGNSVAAYGSNDVFVTKLNTNGVQQWFKLSGSTSADTIGGLVVDSVGNVVVAGTIFGTAANNPKDFNGTTITGIASSDAYVAQLNSNGVQQWFKVAGGNSNETVVALTIDASDNIYLTGIIVAAVANAPVNFVGVTVTGFGGDDVYVAKLNSDGVQQWLRLAGSTTGDSVAALTVDSNGNVYIGGGIVGAGANTPKDFTGTTVVGVGNTDNYVAKLNSSGVQQWFKLSGGTQGDSLTSIVVDGSGNVFATGTINTTSLGVTPKDFTLTTITGYGSADVFVAKLDSAGTQLWFKLTGSSANDSWTALSLDAAGNTYVTGLVGGSNSPRDFSNTAVTGIGSADVFVAKLDTSGVQQWYRLAGFSNTDAVAAMFVDTSGSVYLSGTFTSQTSAGRDFAGTNIASPTGSASVDIYVVRLNTNGVQQQFDLIGSTSTEAVRTFRVDSLGNATIVGTYQGTVDFDSGPGTLNRTSNGNSDAYVWRLLSASNTTVRDTALDQVTAANVQIGNATSGPITVVSNQTRPTATNVELVSGGAISFTAGSFSTAGGDLKITPGSGANATAPKAGVDVDMGSTGKLSFGSGSTLGFDIRGTIVDTQYDQLNVVGKVDLTGTSLVLSGSYVPLIGDRFILVNNDGADDVTGTFNGLSQGATVIFNGVSMTISYTGGDGNDVVLSNGSVNTPPTAVNLTPLIASLAENASTVSAIALSTITITDDGQGTNSTFLTGADAGVFEIVGNQLRLKAGTTLDFEAKTSYLVRVNVDDTSIGGTPDAFVDFTLNITDIADAPSLTSIVVNGGDAFAVAAQRSQVTSLVVTFSVPVVLGSDPFTIVNRDLPVLQQVPIPVTVTGSGTTYTIRFGAGSGVLTRDTSIGLGRGNSLVDGNFLLTINPSKVTDRAAVQTLTPTNSFGDGDNEFGDRAVDNFFRFFGDADGNGVVNSIDTGAFSRALTAYNAAVDFDGNGSVSNSGVDRTNFLGNFNKRRRSF